MTKRDVLDFLYRVGVSLLVSSAAAAILAINNAIGGELVGDIPKPEAPRCYCCE